MTAPEQTNHLAGALVAIAQEHRRIAHKHLVAVALSVGLAAVGLFFHAFSDLAGASWAAVVLVPAALAMLNSYAEETRLAVAYEGVAALVRRHPELTVSVIDYVTRGDMSAAILRLHNLSRRRLRA